MKLILALSFNLLIQIVKNECIQQKGSYQNNDQTCKECQGRYKDCIGV